MNQAERRRFLIDALVAEELQIAHARNKGELTVPAGAEGQRRLLRALMNIRPPRPIAPELAKVQDAYLAQRLIERGGAAQADDLDELEPHIALWLGDITLLAADAVVNAANAQGLGCFAPNHGCIDNAIHTYAGMQLRLACAEELRGRVDAGPSFKTNETDRNRAFDEKKLVEPHGGIRATREIHTGEAIITPGFNLPAKHVIHTVGPIVSGPRPTARDKAALASCYRSCLDLACENGLGSVAFCCISTGVFRYPPREAAQVAVSTVRAFLHDRAQTQRAGQTSQRDEDGTPDAGQAATTPRKRSEAIPQEVKQKTKAPDYANEPPTNDNQPSPRIPKVVFNVFTESDYRIYRELLG